VNNVSFDDCFRDQVFLKVCQTDSGACPLYQLPIRSVPNFTLAHLFVVVQVEHYARHFLSYK
jgi:hypothetical protein